MLLPSNSVAKMSVLVVNKELSFQSVICARSKQLSSNENCLRAFLVMKDVKFC